MTTYDFAIVGAGIAGASLAARLSQHARVLLLERESAPGYHTTGRSAALYSALYGNDCITAITRASRAFFEQPPSGFCEHPLLAPRGVLYAGGEPDAQAIDAIAASPLAQRISTARALELVPVLQPASAVHCAYEADAFDLDVNALHTGFLRQARRAGAVLVCDAGLTTLRRQAGIWQLDTTAGAFAANVVVNAAGAWADAVAQLAGAQPLGLQPLHRTAIVIEPPAGVDSGRWPAMIAADESYYFKPDAGLLLASPADETPSAACDAQPDDLDIAICVDRLETRTSLRVRRVVRAWAGLRTFAPDRTPVVGYDPQVDGFFWLAGQGGYGVQTAPALSDIAAALALRRELPAQVVAEGVDAAMLAPGRFDAGAAAT